MADEPTEPTLDQQLDALQAETTPPPAATVPPVVAGQPAAPPTTPPPAEPPAEPAPSLDDKLKAIEDTPSPVEPKLTDEQQQVLAVVPTPAALQQLQTQAVQLQRLSEVVAARDFDAMESMFDASAMEDFREHIYQKYVADRESEWVARWIAEHEGQAPVHTGFKRLEQQIGDLKRQLAQRQTADQSQQLAAEQQRIAAAYVSHLNGLFDKIEFSAADRPWVTANIHQRVAADPRIRAAINSGNPAAVNAIFKTAVKEYVQRDQATTQATATMLKSQELHKPLAPASPITQLGSLPDNINDVPHDKLDDWMNEQIEKLGAATTGRRK